MSEHLPIFPVPQMQSEIITFKSNAGAPPLGMALRNSNQKATTHHFLQPYLGTLNAQSDIADNL